MSEIDINKIIAKADPWPVDKNEAPKRMQTIDDVVDYLTFQRNSTSSLICWMKSSDVKYILTLKAADIDKYFKGIKLYDRTRLSKKEEAEEALKKDRTNNKLDMPKIDLIELIYRGDHDQILEAIKQCKKDLAENQKKIETESKWKGVREQFIRGKE